MSKIRRQALLLMGSLMTFAYSIAVGCSGGNCPVIWVSATGVFLLLLAIGKHRWLVLVTMLVLMLLLRGSQGLMPVSPGCG